MMDSLPSNSYHNIVAQLKPAAIVEQQEPSPLQGRSPGIPIYDTVLNRSVVRKLEERLANATGSKCVYLPKDSNCYQFFTSSDGVLLAVFAYQTDGNKKIEQRSRIMLDYVLDLTREQPIVVYYMNTKDGTKVVDAWKDPGNVANLQADDGSLELSMVQLFNQYRPRMKGKQDKPIQRPSTPINYKAPLRKFRNVSRKINP